MEDWTQIRRLRRAEVVSDSEIARQMGISRDTVRSGVGVGPATEVSAGVAADVSAGVAADVGADGVEAQVRALLAEFPRMPAAVIAQRIDWQHSLSHAQRRGPVIRPEYVAHRTAQLPALVLQVRWCQAWRQSTGGGAVPRRLRLRRRADRGTVFAHGRQRRLVTKREDAIPHAKPADLLVGRITTFVDRVRLQHRRQSWHGL